VSRNQKGQDIIEFALMLALVVIVGALLVYGAVAIKGSFDNRVTDRVAISQFRVLTGADDVVIVTRSNDTWLFGHMDDVVYTLSVDGKLMGGRCVSGPWSPVICRVYGAGDGE